MLEAWVALLLFAVALAATGYFFFARRSPPVAFANAREEQLTRRVARDVGCTPEQALPAVRHEIDLAPGQSDETLARRAIYHYRQALPADTCHVYRDRARG